MALTWFEEGLEKGLEQGLSAQRELLAVQVDEKFGPLSADVRRRIAEWPADQLTDLARRIVRAQSLRELGLED